VCVSDVQALCPALDLLRSAIQDTHTEAQSHQFCEQLLSITLTFLNTQTKVLLTSAHGKHTCPLREVSAYSVTSNWNLCVQGSNQVLKVLELKFKSGETLENRKFYEKVLENCLKKVHVYL